jgi:hypothetical protein
MANGNPLIQQGFLNRVKGSVTWDAFPQLNVTAPYLDREGINMRLTGNSSAQLQTLTGTVQSPECYISLSVVIALLKTQTLAEAYKTQWEAYSVLGAGTIWPDVAIGGISSFRINNAAIENVADLLFNGTTPLYGVTCTGYYVVNNNLFNQ